MTSITAEMEQEFAQELAGGAVPIQEVEGEAFYNHLGAMADRSGRLQSLRAIALGAARDAFQSALAKKPYAVVEGEAEAEIAEMEMELLRAIVRPPNIRDIAGEMEHLGHQAVAAETEHEAAEQFFPLIALAGKALLPMAAKAIGGLAKKALPKLISKVAPQLTRGIGGLARTLHRSPATRQLIRAVPRIARGTMSDVARRVAAGRSITGPMAARMLARNTVRELGNPRRLQQTWQRSRALDHHHHQRAARRVGGVMPPALRRIRRTPAGYPAATTVPHYAGAPAFPAYAGASGVPGMMGGGMPAMPNYVPPPMMPGAMPTSSTTCACRPANPCASYVR